MLDSLGTPLLTWSGPSPAAITLEVEKGGRSAAAAGVAARAAGGSASAASAAALPSATTSRTDAGSRARARATCVHFS
jgi:hypothetical protein